MPLLDCADNALNSALGYATQHLLRMREDLLHNNMVIHLGRNPTSEDVKDFSIITIAGSDREFFCYKGQKLAEIVQSFDENVISIDFKPV